MFVHVDGLQVIFIHARRCAGKEGEGVSSSLCEASVDGVAVTEVFWFSSSSGLLVHTNMERLERRGG